MTRILLGHLCLRRLALCCMFLSADPSIGVPSGKAFTARARSVPRRRPAPRQRRNRSAPSALLEAGTVLLHRSRAREAVAQAGMPGSPPARGSPYGASYLGPTAPYNTTRGPPSSSGPGGRARPAPPSLPSVHTGQSVSRLPLEGASVLRAVDAHLLTQPARVYRQPLVRDATSFRHRSGQRVPERVGDREQALTSYAPDDAEPAALRRLWHQAFSCSARTAHSFSLSISASVSPRPLRSHPAAKTSMTESGRPDKLSHTGPDAPPRPSATMAPPVTSAASHALTCVHTLSGVVSLGNRRCAARGRGPRALRIRLYSVKGTLDAPMQRPSLGMSAAGRSDCRQS